MITQDYIKEAVRTENYSPVPPLGELEWRIKHGIIGITTEAGELLDIIKKREFYGKSIDLVNLKEEIGDLFWYIAILCDAAQMDPESICAVNIAKLKTRYPEKFTQTCALNRDLEAERKVLEGV